MILYIIIGCYFLIRGLEKFKTLFDGRINAKKRNFYFFKKKLRVENKSNFCTGLDGPIVRQNLTRFGPDGGPPDGGHQCVIRRNEKRHFTVSNGFSHEPELAAVPRGPNLIATLVFTLRETF